MAASNAGSRELRRERRLLLSEVMAGRDISGLRDRGRGVISTSSSEDDDDEDDEDDEDDDYNEWGFGER